MDITPKPAKSSSSRSAAPIHIEPVVVSASERPTDPQSSARVAVELPVNASGAVRAAENPVVRAALIALAREWDRVYRHGPESTMESRVRALLATPGLRALLYEGG